MQKLCFNFGTILLIEQDCDICSTCSRHIVCKFVPWAPFIIVFRDTECILKLTYDSRYMCDQDQSDSEEAITSLNIVILAILLTGHH